MLQVTATSVTYFITQISKDGPITIAKIRNDPTLYPSLEKTLFRSVKGWIELISLENICACCTFLTLHILDLSGAKNVNAATAGEFLTVFSV